MIDIYCERTVPGWWDEPLNTITNLGFLLAAGVALWCYLQHRERIPDRGLDLWLLMFWLVAIGIGSGLWHLSAEAWGLWLDVVSIQLFILTFLYSFMRRVLAWGWGRMGLSFIAFIALNALVGATVGDAFNGSAGYFPAYGVLLLMAVYVHRQGLPQAGLFALACGVFLPSVTFRSLDYAVCDAFSVGTHFLWHVLNAVVLGSLLVAMIRFSARAASPGSTAVD